jgi:hypothetical protein
MVKALLSIGGVATPVGLSVGVQHLFLDDTNRLPTSSLIQGGTIPPNRSTSEEPFDNKNAQA